MYHIAQAEERATVHAIVFMSIASGFICVHDELWMINSLLIVGCLDFKRSAYGSSMCNQQQIDLENIVLLYMNFIKSKRKKQTKTKHHEIPKTCICRPVLVKLKNNVLKGIGSGMCAPNIRG